MCNCERNFNQHKFSIERCSRESEINCTLPHIQLCFLVVIMILLLPKVLGSLSLGEVMLSLSDLQRVFKGS